MSKETQAAWYQKNKELTKKHSKEWAKNNPEKRKKIRRKSHLKYQRERYVQTREYQSTHPEIVEKKLKSTREWKKEHPENKRATENKRRTMKTGAGGAFTPEEWLTLCDKYYNRCLCCGLGRMQLKSLKRTLAADHIVPVSKGGSSDISNMQPLCHSSKLGSSDGCNNKKNSKTIDYRKT